jgi:hypothetical protein
MSVSSGSSPHGEIQGILEGNTARRRTKSALAGDNVSKDLLGEENLFLPYDQLVQMGRVAPGTNGFQGLSGSQSRIGRDIQGFEGSLASGDPVFAQYQKLEQNALAGLNAGGDGLPDDFRRTLTEDVRSSQASRGLVDSDTSAIQEAARLMGGSEQIRSSRLQEVQGYLSGVTNQALGYLLPNMSTLYGGELQRSMAGANAALGSMGVQNTAAARGNVSASL